MNFFTLWINEQGEKELITCGLGGEGIILPGVTRDSVIKQTKEWGIQVTERNFTIDEFIKAISEGRVLEAFGTGTATVICPVSKLTHEGKVISLFYLFLFK